jgi:hypothetical protein
MLGLLNELSEEPSEKNNPSEINYSQSSDSLNEVRNLVAGLRSQIAMIASLNGLENFDQQSECVRLFYLQSIDIRLAITLRLVNGLCGD